MVEIYQTVIRNIKRAKHNKQDKLIFWVGEGSRWTRLELLCIVPAPLGTENDLQTNPWVHTDFEAYGLVVFVVR